MDVEKTKILIVEDDVFVRDIYDMKFQQEGFAVVLAVDGLEALQRLEESVPDIILLDMMMPKMDGMEVLKKIKENEAWKHIPVIMLTNISDKEKVDEALRQEGVDYLIKSHFTPSEVVSKVYDVLKK